MPMQVDLFTVCDAATFSEGKINLLGTFDTIWAPSFPCLYDSFSIVAQVRLSPEEQGTHTLQIHWIDPDGEPFGPSHEKEFHLHFDERISETYSLIWNLRGKEFFGEGESYFELHVDGTFLARVPFYVREKCPPRPD